MAKLYSLKSVERLIDRYLDIEGGEIKTIEEGVLGYGVTVCTAPNKKTSVIKEIYINGWSSGHTIRKYNKTPKKYL